jgi:hypothetical protein
MQEHTLEIIASSGSTRMCKLNQEDKDPFPAQRSHDVKTVWRKAKIGLLAEDQY